MALFSGFEMRGLCWRSGMRSACVFSSWLNDSKLISVRAIRLRASLENLSLSSCVPLSVLSGTGSGN